MKKIVLSVTFATFAALASLSAFAADEHAGHGAMAGMHETTMVYGTVKKIDKAAGKVTLAHGPLTNLGMNMPMTMAFRVKEAAWLGEMKVGDKIRFVAEDTGGTLMIEQFEPAR